MTSSHASNRLAHATSPYLLQHANNPVDWFEWGHEALTRAKQEDKPILLSIGYSSCHWCHVMAHESFENEDIAQLMNEYFVCIKLDREERPDIDQIYMEAVQAMGQNGGWPLNVFLTPDQKPFFGGTYFPPKNWAQLLVQINKAFREKRNEINESANDLSKHLAISDLQRFKNVPSSNGLNSGALDAMHQVIESRFDFNEGGLDKAPKFIMPSIWLFLLRYYHLQKNPKTLEMLHLTLKKIAAGGIYDQIGGGFARYSVDGQWFAPHFEKMLYDNGQLLSLYAEAYRLTKEPVYARIIRETVAWLEREMTSPEGGFYSALDADSEGEEGKFYTWQFNELKELNAEEIQLLTDHYHITPEGNWEHGKNILFRESETEPSPALLQLNEKLLAIRNKKIKPGLDDKILTGWNAITIQGLVDAYRSLGEDRYLELAERALQFIEQHLMVDGKLYRSFKGTHSTTTAFIDDHSFLIQAYTSLYQATQKEYYLIEAKKWCEETIRLFYDEAEGFFYFNSHEAESLIARKKEVFDNVIPSSNSVMARNLFHLSIFWDHENWKTMASQMMQRLISLTQSEPIYMCHWALLAAEMTHGMAEVVITGTKAPAWQSVFDQNYIPFVLFMSGNGTSTLPLVADKQTDLHDAIFVCFNKTCQLPVSQVEEAIKQLKFKPAN
jgi:uncharacterized protein YyaL (SSP411 family)